MSRDVNRQFGINWNTILSASDFSVAVFTGRQFLNNAGVFQSGSAYGSVLAQYNNADDQINLNGVLDALENEQLLRILAEPNLTAVSGETAEFLAGGEVGVSGTGENNNVIFKQYGVSLSFSPQVIAADRIRLRIAPEVSQLAATTINDGAPALEVRRMSTTVELASGQSFVIGGLLQNNYNNVVDKLPGLGNLPVLGALFRSQAFSRRESELIVMVTPTIVHANSDGSSQTQKRELQPVIGIEQIFSNILYGSADGAYSSGLHLPGSARYEGEAGFVY